jgi:hypothetical protein
VSRSPRFSALLIGLRSLGFVGALWTRRTLVPVSRLAPLLLWRCARGGSLPYTAGAPDQGADRIGFPIRRSHSEHLSAQEYSELAARALEADEILRNKVEAAMAQVGEANESESGSLRKLEEAQLQVEECKKALQDALTRVDAAKQGRLQ